MFWPRSAPVLDVALGPSRVVATGTSAIYALALAAPFLSGLPRTVAILLALVLTASWAWVVTVRCLRLAPNSIRRIVLSDEEVVLVDRRGGARTGTLLPGAWVGGGLIVLRVKLGRRVIPVVIAKGAAGSDAFRRLRLRLRVAPRSPRRRRHLPAWFSGNRDRTA